MGKGINFLASGAGQLHIDMGKNELQHTPQTWTNMNSKWIIVLNIQSKTLGLLEKHKKQSLRLLIRPIFLREDTKRKR